MRKLLGALGIGLLVIISAFIFWNIAKATLFVSPFAGFKEDRTYSTKIGDDMFAVTFSNKKMYIYRYNDTILRGQVVGYVYECKYSGEYYKSLSFGLHLGKNIFSWKALKDGEMAIWLNIISDKIYNNTDLTIAKKKSYETIVFTDEYMLFDDMKLMRTDGVSSVLLELIENCK